MSDKVGESWDRYWQGTGEFGAYSSGGVSHPAILAFWNQFFQATLPHYAAPAIADIASGNGAVAESALSACADRACDITCVDISTAAIANIHRRFPSINGLVADAASLPLESSSFDIVTSQFGVEYAGLTAITEAARLLAPAGQLVLLMHNKNGSIHSECQANLDAVQRLQKSNFLSSASAMLRAGFEACRGANRQPYETAAKQLAPAVHELESIMQEHGERVADDTIARLYGDVDQIHRNMPGYDPTEVLGWLAQMEDELETYCGRMSSMCEAAIDAPTFEQVCANLQQSGCSITRAEPFVATDATAGARLLLAWLLIASRSET